MKRWRVYLLRCRDRSLYCGITTDIARRVMQHDAGLGSSYTRSKLPVVLVWMSGPMSESASRRLEATIKSFTKKQKEALVTKTLGPDMLGTPRRG